ncbi:MAG: hypothetical protein PSY12_07370 [bacterium]|nr:hypothetical protein [bacterium]
MAMSIPDGMVAIWLGGRRLTLYIDGMVQFLRFVFLPFVLVILCCAPARPEPLLGFNEELILGNLLYARAATGKAGWDRWCTKPRQPCTENAPPLSLSSAGVLLDSLYGSAKSVSPAAATGACPVRGRARAVHREIISLRIAEPEDGRDAAIFLSDIESVLRLYARRDIELILAFGSEALPDGISAGAPDDRARMVRLADTITDFVGQVDKRGKVDRCWMASRLRIEPMNEFNAFNGNPAMMAVLDNETRSRLTQAAMPVRDVLSSSIISGRPADYMSWYRDYYAHGGRAIPNIHLYPEADLDRGKTAADRWAATQARFKAIVMTLKSTLSVPQWDERRWDGRPRGLLISEIGFPSVGPRALGTASRPLDFLASTRRLGSTSMTEGDRILVWRVFRDWDGARNSPRPLSRFNAMALQQSENYSFGFIDYWTGEAYAEPGAAGAADNSPPSRSSFARALGKKTWRVSSEWNPRADK